MTRSELIAMAKSIADAHALDPVLICSIVEQESAWDPYAFRPESESGFAARYGAAYAEIVRKSASKTDDRWFRFEDVFFASWGLMQTMYCVIIETFPEQASALKYPSSLCDPQIGLTQGCRLFERKLQGAGGNVELALLRWNGGGNPNYPREVLARKVRYA